MTTTSVTAGTAPGAATRPAATGDRATSTPCTAARIGLVAGPALLFAGSFIHPDEPTKASGLQRVIEQHQGQWAAAHVLLYIGAALSILAVLTLGWALAARAPKLAATGIGLSIIGVLGVSYIFITSASLTPAGHGDARQMARLLDRVQSAPAYVGAEMLSIGLLVGLPMLIAGLAGTGIIRRPAGALAAVAPLLVIGPEPLPCIGWATVTVVLAVQGKRIVTSRD